MTVEQLQKQHELNSLLIKGDNQFDIILENAIEDLQRARGIQDLTKDNYSIKILMQRYDLSKEKVIEVLNYKLKGIL